MPRPEKQDHSVGIKVAHGLFLFQLIVFLVLVVGSGRPWCVEIMETLALTDAQSILDRPWVLITYSFLNSHPLEFIVAGGVLLLAGVQVEHKLGALRFLLLYLLGAFLVGLCHVACLEGGLVTNLYFQGSVGTCAGLLSAYLFLFGHEKRVGSVPYPIFYLACAAAISAVALTVDYEAGSTLAHDQHEQISIAAGSKTTIEEKVRAVREVDALAERRPDCFAHLLGLAMGALSLMLTLAAARTSKRYRVLREIRGLQEEVDARARVEELLAKISSDGIGSLTRNERKFLRYASRFYQNRLSRTR